MPPWLSNTFEKLLVGIISAAFVLALQWIQSEWTEKKSNHQTARSIKEEIEAISTGVAAIQIDGYPLADFESMIAWGPAIKSITLLKKSTFSESFPEFVKIPHGVSETILFYSITESIGKNIDQLIKYSYIFRSENMASWNCNEATSDNRIKSYCSLFSATTLHICDISNSAMKSSDICKNNRKGYKPAYISMNAINALSMNNR